MRERDRSAPHRALQCLGGEEPSPETILGLKDLLLLPSSAKAHFWDAFGPTLQHPLPNNLEEILTTFQRKHNAPQGRLARAIEACRTLFQGAGRQEISADAFKADLTLISTDAEQLAAVLMPGFEQAMATVKKAILHGTLLDHGNLLIDVSWRVDSMLHSHRGRKLYSPVTLVTLRYLEGKNEHRITLQALPDLLKRLQAMCEEILE